jgi:hypothetical protein
VQADLEQDVDDAERVPSRHPAGAKGGAIGRCDHTECDGEDSRDEHVDAEDVGGSHRPELELLLQPVRVRSEFSVKADSVIVRIK